MIFIIVYEGSIDIYNNFPAIDWNNLAYLLK